MPATVISNNEAVLGITMSRNTHSTSVLAADSLLFTNGTIPGKSSRTKLNVFFDNFVRGDATVTNNWTGDVSQLNNLSLLMAGNSAKTVNINNPAPNIPKNARLIALQPEQTAFERLNPSVNTFEFTPSGNFDFTIAD